MENRRADSRDVTAFNKSDLLAIERERLRSQDPARRHSTDVVSEHETGSGADAESSRKSARVQIVERHQIGLVGRANAVQTECDVVIRAIGWSSGIKGILRRKHIGSDSSQPQ